MSELDDLRKLVLAEHQRAARKISRNKRAKGIDLAGSIYDPRINRNSKGGSRQRDAKTIGRYNSSQLRAYLDTLKEFNNRQTQFEAGSGGAPLERRRVRVMQYLISERNKEQTRLLDALQNVKMPYGDDSVAARAERMNPTAKYRANQFANSPNVLPTDPKSVSVTTPRNLEKLIASLKSNLGTDGARKRARDMRKQIDSMTKVLPKDQRNQINKLVKRVNDEQLNILFNYTSFANSLSVDYEHFVRSAKDKDNVQISAADSEIAANEFESAVTHARWAAKIKW